MTDWRSVAALGLLVSLAASAAAPPEAEEVRRSVDALASEDLETRERARKRLLDWGAERPEEILRLLPETHADAEARSNLDSLRREIPVESRGRRALALADEGGGAEWRGTVEALYRDPTGDAFDRFAGLPLPKPLRARILVDLAGGDPEWLRDRAVSALTNLQEPSILPEILKLLASPRPEIRRGAFCVYLGNAGEAPDPKPVAAMLSDPDPGLRGLAAGTLGMLQAKEEAEAVGKLLADPSGEVRLMATHALALLGHRASIPAIAKLLDDPDPGVPPHAAQSLQILSGEKWPDAPAEKVAAAQAWWKEHSADTEFSGKPAGN